MQLILKFEKFLKFLLISVVGYLIICFGITIVQYLQELAILSEYEYLQSVVTTNYVKILFRLIILFTPVITFIVISLRSILNEKKRILNHQDQQYEMFITQGYFKTFGLLLNNFKIVMIILISYSGLSVLLYIYYFYDEITHGLGYIDPDFSRLILYAISTVLNLVFTVLFIIKTTELFNLKNSYKYLKSNGHYSEDNNYSKPIINFILSIIIVVLVLILCISFRVTYSYIEFGFYYILDFVMDIINYSLLMVGPILVISSFVSSKKFQTSNGLYANNFLEKLSDLSLFLIINFAAIIIFELLIYNGEVSIFKPVNLFVVLIIICSIVALIYNIINLVVSTKKYNKHY